MTGDGTYDMMYAVADDVLAPYTTAPWRTRFGLVPLRIEDEPTVRGIADPPETGEPR